MITEAQRRVARSVRGCCAYCAGSYVRWSNHLPAVETWTGPQRTVGYCRSCRRKWAEVWTPRIVPVEPKQKTKRRKR